MGATKSRRETPPPYLLSIFLCSREPNTNLFLFLKKPDSIWYQHNLYLTSLHYI